MIFGATVVDTTQGFATNGVPDQVWFLLLGWVLGILSIELHGLVDRFRDRRSFIRSTITELREIRLRLAVAVNEIYRRDGTLKPKHTEWFYQQVASYEGPMDVAKLLEDAEKYNKFNNEQLLVMNESFQIKFRTLDKLLSFPSFDVRYLDANMDMLRRIKTEDQSRLLRIRTLLQWINDLLEENATGNFQTLSGGIGLVDNLNIRDNQKRNLVQIASFARAAVDKIAEYTAKA